jgi:precorrin-6Y C5,15-methyltransferase (decarboxylating)
MHYGVGATLSRHISRDEMLVLPQPSSFSLAAARMGWALQDCQCLTVHGRSLDLVHPNLHPGLKLLILSEGGHTPKLLANLLTGRRFGASKMTVLEHMGALTERRLEGIAAAWPHSDCADLNVIAVECQGHGGLSNLAGLPDDVFHHDGQLTKRDIRAVTLSRLAPEPGQLLWDVGAGCGSISIEWMRTHPSCRAIAVEANAKRQSLIALNKQALGVPGLTIIAGQAPKALTGLEAPDSIFIGGGLTAPDLPKICWEALKPGGRIVINAVTLESQALALRLHQEWGGDLCQLSVSHSDGLGRFHVWRPALPVAILSVVKPI